MNANRPHFPLHDFLRVTWVSQAAQSTWKPRLESIRETWPQAAVSMTGDGMSPCVIRTVPPWMIFRLQADARRAGIAVHVLGLRGLAVPGYAMDGKAPSLGKPFCYDAVIGREPWATQVEQAWEARDFGAAYGLAGIPECCVRAFELDVRDQRIDPHGALRQKAQTAAKNCRAKQGSIRSGGGWVSTR